MTHLIQRLAGAAIPMILGISLAGVVEATIVDCPPVPGSFTIYLSEPSMIPATSKEDVRRFLDRLQFELDQHRDGQWVRSPSADVRFVACPDRIPRLDGQEFVPTLIETLYGNRVLLEIWGQLEVDSTGGTGLRRSAQMNYLLVPMRFAANQMESAAPSLQRLPYSDQGKAVPDFVQLIARPRDIDAFVAAALGVKLLRERNYETAHRNLCRASTLLEEMERRSLVGRTRDDVAALHAFAVDSARRSITEGRAGPNYPKTGRLWLFDPKDPCAGGN